MTAHRALGNTQADGNAPGTVTEESTATSSASPEWQQPPLLPQPPRVPRPRALRSSERQRQVGLAGIAQARAALAEASRRATARPHAA